MREKLKFTIIIFSLIIFFPVIVLAEQSASITVTVAIAMEDEVDPNLSTVKVEPSYIPIKYGQSTITVIHKDKRRRLLGSHQTVKIHTTAGKLLDGIIDHGDGTYTQILEASPRKVGVATITAIVNKIRLIQQPNVYFIDRMPDKILMFSGDNQTGIIGAPLKEPLVVKVIDAKGEPVYGVPVSFDFIEGGGSISQEQPVTTDKEGKASVTLSLGPEPARNTITASLESVEGSPVTFTARGIIPLIKAVWLYDLEKMKINEQKNILNKLKDFGINLIYLDLEKDDALLLDTTDGINLVSEFVNLAGMSNISVEGMILQDPSWIDLEKPWKEDVLLRSDEVMRRVNKIIHSDIHFVGIHIDVQPHKHSEWTYSQFEANNELMIRFQTLIGLIKHTILESSSSLPFSATVAWWYNDAADFGILPQGDAQLLSSSFDYMVPTIFENNQLLYYYWNQRIKKRKKEGIAGEVENQSESEGLYVEGDNQEEYLAYMVYYCVIDEIKELEGTGKGVVIGLAKQGGGSNKEILSLIDWVDNKLYTYDSYFGTLIYKPSLLVSKKAIIILGIGQINLSVNSPQGSEIDRENMIYLESNPNQYGIVYDKIIISNPFAGEYQINVIPESDSKDTDTFTLIVIINGQELVMAEDIQIKDLPVKPYSFSFPISSQGEKIKADL